MTPVTVVSGDSPIILAQPHSGTWVPPEIMSRLNALGRKCLDTDWHIPTLYDGLLPDATVVRANFNRYVVDANRDPSGTSLYPGQNTTGLVPLISFDDQPIWTETPTAEDIALRLEAFHKPYHAALVNALERAKTKHGFAVLYDCHSIRSVIPHLFEGPLPDLNIGTFNGVSCAATIQAAVEGACASQDKFSFVTNGRFKGGWTTRDYGKPADGIHAIQMEISQRTYLETETEPFKYDGSRAEILRDCLRAIFSNIQTSLLDL